MPDLIAYIDDSWSEHQQVFTLAGYMAHASLWEECFIPRWRSMLATAPLPIAELKTSDCRHGVGEFLEWRRDERTELFIKAVDIIVQDTPSTDIAGFASSVALQGEPIEPTVRVWQEVAFRWCMTQLLLNMMDVAGSYLTPGDQIQIVVDKKPGFRRLMDLQWNAVRSLLSTKLEDKIVCGPEWGDSCDVLPLQAADLLAYETSHEAKQRVLLARRPVSKALKRLVEGRHHHADCTWYVHAQEEVNRHINGEKHVEGYRTLLFRSEHAWRTEQQWPHPVEVSRGAVRKKL